MSRRAPGEAITDLGGFGRPRPRHVLRSSLASHGARLGVHNNSCANAVRAVRERVFAVEREGSLQAPPRPLPGVFADRLAPFRAGLLRRLGHCTPWTADEFVSSYSGSKRRRYEQAVHSLRVRGVDHTDAYLQSFVKAEAVNFTAKPDPAPRIIQPRSARYNASVGPYIRPLEHRIYGAIGRIYGGPTVMKGYNATDVAGHLRDMWDWFNRPVCILLDASRFDQHVSLQALQWEHSVYNGVYRSANLARLLRLQLQNKGFCRCPDGSFSYKVEGCRMSGDMNTALGNCLIMCALVWAYAEEVGVKVRLANNGDDCAVFMEKGDQKRFLSKLDRWFLEMGFTLTCDGVADVFEHVDFCQTRPVWTARGWVMCRSPQGGMAKDTMWKQPDRSSPIAGYNKWQYQVGLAGQSLTAGVPVLYESYRAMVRNGTPCLRAQGFGNMESGFEHLAKGMRDDGVVVTPEARVSFWLAWGITPDQQVALEHHFQQLGPLLVCRSLMSEADYPGIWIPDGEA